MKTRQSDRSSIVAILGMALFAIASVITAQDEGAAPETPAAETAIEAAPAAEPAMLSKSAQEEAIKLPSRPAYEAYDIKNRVRAIWLDMRGETYNTPFQIRRILQTIRDGGFNEVYLIVVRGGEAMYPSQILPLAPAVTQELPDPVRAFIESAREGDRSLKVTLVLLPLEAFSGTDLSAASARNILRQRREWMLLNDVGSGRQPDKLYSLDPAIPQVRDWAARVVQEAAERYPDADGIQLHRLRYPGTDAEWGYSTTSVTLFNKETGNSGSPRPEDREWQQWRRSQLTDLVQQLVAAAKEGAPDVRVQVTGETAGLPPADKDEWTDSAVYAGALQDWVGWAESGLMDELVLLNFQSAQFDTGRFDAWLNFAVDQHGDADLVVGLGEAENFAEEVLQQIRNALATEAKGVALFSYQEPNIENIRTKLFLALGKSLFSEEYSGLRRSNIAVDPGFADWVTGATTDTVTRRTREDIEIPEEFEGPVALIEEEGQEAVEGAPGEETARPEAAPATAATGAPLLPDMIVLHSGGTLRGRILRETASSIDFRNEAGFELTIERDEIRSIQRAQR